MAIEVRCGCGQMVYAEGRFAGQHVQCPHCKAAVAVPVGVAAAAAPPPAPESPMGAFWRTETGYLVYMGGGLALLTLLVGYFKG